MADADVTLLPHIRAVHRRSRLTGPFAFFSDRRAVSAVEFAFIAPLAIMLLLAGFDMSRFILATERCSAVANAMAQMLSTTPVSALAQTPGDGVISSSDVMDIANSAWFIFPESLAESVTSGQAFGAVLQGNMASVRFTATPAGCTTNCTYTPKYVWTYAAGPDARHCGGATITAVADTAPYSPTALPANVFGPNSLVVVDIFYTFRPTLGARYLKSIKIQRSAFLNPRFATTIEAADSQYIEVCS